MKTVTPDEVLEQQYGVDVSVLLEHHEYLKAGKCQQSAQCCSDLPQSVTRGHSCVYPGGH